MCLRGGPDSGYAWPMAPLELARAYLDIFTSGEGLERLMDLFAPDLHFSGPFRSFDSARAYVDALAADPVVHCDYQLLAAHEDGASACLVYHFMKPDMDIPMAQVFEVEKGKITSILLIFDTAAFS